MEATKKQAEAWEALIPQIEAMELEGNGDESEGVMGAAPGHMVGV